MKRVTRVQLRGEPLFSECKSAYTTTNEYGPEDNRIFCFGLFEDSSDSVVQGRCINCKAFVDNAKPMAEKIEKECEKKQKTLAQLKRDANSGRLKLELVEHYGKTGEEIPERLRGIRQVKRANSVGLMITNNAGVDSELRIESAKLLEYTDDFLIIYEAGYREPTEEELDVLDNIKNIYDRYEDSYSGGYWQVEEYCKACSCPWMRGHEVIQGKRYDFQSKKVMDNKIKGEPILKYRVYL